MQSKPIPSLRPNGVARALCVGSTLSQQLHDQTAFMMIMVTGCENIKCRTVTLCMAKMISASCLFSWGKPAGRGAGVQLMLAVDGYKAVLLVNQLGRK